MRRKTLRRVLSLLLSATLLMTSVITGVVLPVAAADTPIAVDISTSTVTASSQHSSHVATRIADGNTGTMWSSDPNTYEASSNQWVQLELASATLLDEVRLYPRWDTTLGCLCFPSDFTIQVSQDGIIWTTVVTETDYAVSANEWQVFSFAPQLGVRFIKVDVTKLSTENPTASKLSYRCQFMEIEAYYTPLDSLADYVAAITSVGIDEETSHIIMPTVPDATVTLKSSSNTDVVAMDGEVDTVNAGSTELVFTVSNGTEELDTAPITVSFSGVLSQAEEKINLTAAEASSQANTQWAISKLIDGQTQTGSSGWSSKQYSTPTPTSGADWAVVTMGKTALVKSVILYPRYRTSNRGIPLDFEIQVSTDNVNWTTAYAVNDYPIDAGSYNAAQTIQLETPVYGQYVRLWCTELSNDSATAYSVQLAELEVYGIPMTLQTLDEAAAGLQINQFDVGDSTVSWSGVNQKFFHTEITASTHPSVIATDKTLTLPESTVEVTLSMFIQNRLNKTESVTVDRTVTVKSETGLQTDIAAQSITLFPLPDTDAATVTMPTPDVGNPDEYTVTVETSSDTSIIALDGTLTRPSETTGVTVTLRVTHTASGEYALTQPLLVPVYKPYVAPTMTDAEIEAQLDKYENSAYGLFVHYVPAWTNPDTGKMVTGGTVDAAGNKITEVDVLAENFDVEQFAAEAHEFGVEYVIFTAWHADMRTLFPSMANQRWRDDRRGEDTVGEKSYADYDMIDALLTALEAYDIDLHLYTHPSDAHDFTLEDQALTGGDYATTKDYALWNEYVNELYYEMCERYGTRLKGLWFDGMFSATPEGEYQNRLKATCKAFNPAMVLTMNTGFDQKIDSYVNSTAADYRSWEVQRINLEHLSASHNQSSAVLGANWFTVYPQANVPGYVGGETENTAESVYRYLALISSVSTHGGFAAALGVYPEMEGESLDNLWENSTDENSVYHVLANMNTQYLTPVQESVKNVVPSLAYPTVEKSVLTETAASTYNDKTDPVTELTWGVASESTDRKTLYLHVLKQPDSANTLTLPATADGSTLASAGTLLNFDGTTTEGVTFAENGDGTVTVTLPEGTVWADNVVTDADGDSVYLDTVIKVAVSRPEVTEVTLNFSTLEVAPYANKQLAFTVDGTAADVAWTSDNKAVATVSRDGTVTGVSEGTATITVTVDGHSASCEVTVSPYANMMQNGDFEGVDPMADWYQLSATLTSGVGRGGSQAVVRNADGNLYIDGRYFTLLPNRSYRFTVYFYGEQGNTGSVWWNNGTASNNNHDVTLISGATSVTDAEDGWRKYTTVFSTGDNPQLVNSYAIAMSNFSPGTVIDDISMVLLPEPESVTLSVDEVELTVGSSTTVAATVSPAGSGGASWTSDNESVATVNALTGEITAVSEGVAVITAQAGTTDASVTVTVSPYANLVVNGDFEQSGSVAWGGNAGVSDGIFTLSGSTQVEQYYKLPFYAMLETNTSYLVTIDHKTVGGGYGELYFGYSGAAQNNFTFTGDARKFKDSNGEWQTKSFVLTTSSSFTNVNTKYELDLIRRVDQNPVNGSYEGTTYFDNLRIVKLDGAYVSAVTNGMLTLSNSDQSGLHLDAVGGTDITVTVTPHSGYMLKPGSLVYVAAGGAEKRVLNKASGSFGEGDGTQFTFTAPEQSVTAVRAEFIRTADTSVAFETIGTSLHYSVTGDLDGVRFLTRLYISDLDVDNLTVMYNGKIHTIVEFGSLLKRTASDADLTLDTVNANLNTTGMGRMWKVVAYTEGDNLRLADHTGAYLDFTVAMTKGASISSEVFNSREYTTRGYLVLDDGTVLYTTPFNDSVNRALSRQ